MLIQIALIGPTQVQRNTGQHWAACVIELLDTTSSDPGLVPAFAGTLRGAGTGSPNSALVSDCTTDDGGPANCSTPHARELLFYQQTSAVADLADLTDQCRTLVTQLTGLTPGGSTSPPTALYVAATTADAQPLPGPTVPAGTQVSCGIQATTPLTGTLIGAGKH